VTALTPAVPLLPGDVLPTLAALRAGRDLVIEAAIGRLRLETERL